MLVYTLYILLVFILRYYLSRIDSEEQFYLREKKYLYVIAGMSVLLAALRGASVGADTRNYLSMYIYVMPERDFNNVYGAFASAPANHYLWKTLSLIGTPPQVLLGLIEFIYVSAIVRFINKYSTDKLISFLIFFICGTYSFSIPALKQTVAMGLVIHAILDFTEQKKIKSILLFVLAFLFHKSSLIFIACFLLYFFKKRKTYYSVIVITCSIALIAGASGFMFFTNVLGDEHYMGYLEQSGQHNLVWFFYYIILAVFSFLNIREYQIERYEESRMFFGLAIVTIVLQSFTNVVDEVFRMAIYFAPCFIVLIPNSAHYSSQKYIKTIALCFMLAFFFYTNRDFEYTFFWQDYNIPYVNFGG